MIGPSLLWIDGVDLMTLDVHVQRVGGIDDTISWSERTAAIPGLMGAVQTAADADVSMREISVDATVLCMSAAALESRLLDLKALLGHGFHELKVYASQSRAYYGRLTRFSTNKVDPQFATATARLQLTFQCLDPLGYDLNLSVVAFGSSYVGMPLGTGPSAPVLYVVGGSGGATNPTITYADAASNTLWTMALTCTIAAGDHVRIDNRLQQITKSVSGVISDARSYLTSSPPRYIVLRPSDGDYSTSSWPQLKVSAGSGIAHFYRTWL